MIKSNLFELNNVLTNGFTLTIWSFVFLIMIMFPMGAMAAVMSGIFCIVLLTTFLRM